MEPETFHLNHVFQSDLRSDNYESVKNCCLECYVNTLGCECGEVPWDILKYHGNVINMGNDTIVIPNYS